jgi:hypothetical protein
MNKTRVVREGRVVMLYEWNVSAKRWELVRVTC